MPNITCDVKFEGLTPDDKQIVNTAINNADIISMYEHLAPRDQIGLMKEVLIEGGLQSGIGVTISLPEGVNDVPKHIFLDNITDFFRSNLVEYTLITYNHKDIVVKK